MYVKVLDNTTATLKRWKGGETAFSLPEYKVSHLILSEIVEIACFWGQSVDREPQVSLQKDNEGNSISLKLARAIYAKLPENNVQFLIIQFWLITLKPWPNEYNIS